MNGKFQSLRMIHSLFFIFGIWSKCRLRKTRIVSFKNVKKIIFTILIFLFPCFQAKTHVLDIEQRLQGVIKTRNRIKGLPLSIEGHVHYLIQEASDENLLCQMYMGWAPYM